jgi:hypothetical protein
MLRYYFFLLVLVTFASALNVASITYDLDKVKLQEVLFLNSSEFKTEPVVHVIIDRFPENFDTVGASVLKPWSYVVLTAEGDVVYSQVISLKDKSTTKPVALVDGQDYISCFEMHCSSETCFCADLTQHRFVSFDPATGNVSTSVDFTDAFSGLVEFQSAFDRKNLIGYYVMLDKTLVSGMYAVNFRTGGWSPLADGFYSNATEAYCYDSTLGMLIGTNHPQGGLFAFDPSSNATAVLMERDLWGITSSPPACDNGQLLLQVVDW